MQIYGCYSERIIETQNLNRIGNTKIRIVTKDGKEYKKSENHWFVKNDTLIFTANGSLKDEANKQEIPFSSIEKIYTYRFDFGATVLLGIGVYFLLGIVTGIIPVMYWPDKFSK
jgi:hypothetical protein